MTRIYLDSAPVIYSVERVAPWYQAVDAKLSAAGVTRLVSDLTRMECRVGPIRSGNVMLLADFDDFFLRSVGAVLSLSPPVCDRAAEIRARFALKTPDAIHLAAATLAGCDVFLTNDRRLAGFPGIVVEIVGP